ncbi:serine/threonine-protein kinase pim-2-like [Synchiropus picturatus]
MKRSKGRANMPPTNTSNNEKQKNEVKSSSEEEDVRRPNKCKHEEKSPLVDLDANKAKEKQVLNQRGSLEDFEKKYHQLQQIGQGGSGSVYAGVRISDCTRVAIKYVEEQDKAFENNVFKAPREVAIMLKAGGTPDLLGKTAVVSLLDWYYFDHKLILIMERPENSIDLYDYIVEYKDGLNEDKAKIFMRQLVNAAIDMHNRGVLHRDLKCENILIELGSQVPRIRIIDFGSGVFLKEKPYHFFSGTVAFAPPEYRYKSEYRAEPMTVWQLGTILYQMLHGDQLYTNSILHSKIDFKELPPDCHSFLKLCLAIEPEERATLQQLQAHDWLKSVDGQPSEG